jgi:hypothetical protein
MQPITRRYARVLNDLDGVLRRLRNLTEEIARIEAESRALHAQARYMEASRKANEAALEKRIDAAEIFYDPALKDVGQEIIPGRIHWEKAVEVHAIHDPIDKTTKILYQPAPEDLPRRREEPNDE